MKIKLTSSFKNSLNSQVRYIAKDKPSAARIFKNDLLNKIRNISQMPYSHRKSIFFEDKEIRDLVFKGYVIVFRINKPKEIIEVFGFAKYKENLF